MIASVAEITNATALHTDTMTLTIHLLSPHQTHLGTRTPHHVLDGLQSGMFLDANAQDYYCQGRKDGKDGNSRPSMSFYPGLHDILKGILFTMMEVSPGGCSCSSTILLGAVNPDDSAKKRKAFPKRKD